MERESHGSFFEQLEQRVVLSAEPFPPLELLENPANAVVRMSTEFGSIDIEVLQEMSTTAESFLNLLRGGAYGETLVHRVEPGTVVGAGIFRFDNDEGLTRREGSVPVIGAVLRSNMERTLSMPVPELTAFASTGEFIINLSDNPQLDGNWLVFARVVQGWEVVQTIAGLPAADLSEQIIGPGAEQLTSVPLVEPAPGQITEDIFARLTDVQIIKPVGIEQFYQHRIYYPEGYSWERVLETLHVANPNVGAASYQVIVRYERGQRDQVIAERQLPAQVRENITVSPDLRASDLVRDHVPYAYEIWSTLPVAADLRHRDFERITRESFFNPDALPTSSLMQKWTFSQAALGTGASDVFVLWQNTTDQATDVTVRFYFENAEPMEFIYELDAHRRGGVNLQGFGGFIGLDEFVGVSVSSDVPIVASLTRYDRRPGVIENEGGAATLGTIGGGSTIGVAPAGQRVALDPVTILNTNASPVTLQFVVTPRVGAVQQMEVTVPPMRLTVLEGSASPVWLAPLGGGYTMEYAASAPVTVGIVSEAFGATRTSFATWAAHEIHFADASSWVSPANLPLGQSSLAVFSPGAPASVVLGLRFDTPPDVQSLPGEWIVGADQTQERPIHQFVPLISQVRGGTAGLTAATRYSLQVLSTTPVVAQMRMLQGDGRTELGMPLTPIALLGETAV